MPSNDPRPCKYSDISSINIGCDTVSVLFPVPDYYLKKALNRHDGWNWTYASDGEARVYCTSNFRFIIKANNFNSGFYATSELSCFNEEGIAPSRNDNNVGNDDIYAVDRYCLEFKKAFKEIKFPLEINDGKISRLDIFFDLPKFPRLQDLMNYVDKKRHLALRLFVKRNEIDLIYRYDPRTTQWSLTARGQKHMNIEHFSGFPEELSHFTQLLKKGQLTAYVGNSSWEIKIYKKYAMKYRGKKVYRHEISFRGTTTCRAALGQNRIGGEHKNNFDVFTSHHRKNAFYYSWEKISKLFNLVYLDRLVLRKISSINRYPLCMFIKHPESDTQNYRKGEDLNASLYNHPFFLWSSVSFNHPRGPPFIQFPSE